MLRSTATLWIRRKVSALRSVRGLALNGLDEALDGLSAGEQTTFESTLEGGDHEGEKAQIHLTLNSVKEEQLLIWMMSLLKMLQNSIPLMS